MIVGVERPSASVGAGRRRLVLDAAQRGPVHCRDGLARKLLVGLLLGVGLSPCCVSSAWRRCPETLLAAGGGLE
jgi:hypothetical protein